MDVEELALIVREAVEEGNYEEGFYAVLDVLTEYCDASEKLACGEELEVIKGITEICNLYAKLMPVRIIIEGRLQNASVH